MTIQELGSVGEFVAAIATIATLFYLAIQIRQNSNSVRMSAEVDMSKQFAAWGALAINNPDLSRIWDLAAEDPDSLTDADIRQFLWFVMELLVFYDSQYLMHLEGQISKENWDAKANMFLGLIQNPIVGRWWESGLGPFSPKFREFVDANRDSANLTWEYASVAAAGRAPKTTVESDT